MNTNDEELHRMQLVAISVLSMANTKDAIAAQRLPADSPYRTLAYADVEKAIDREIELRELAVAGERVREACARACEKRAEERFAEHGTTESDTGASYYGGRCEDEYNARDEEDDECAAAIRALPLAAIQGELLGDLLMECVTCSGRGILLSSHECPDCSGKGHRPYVAIQGEQE